MKHARSLLVAVLLVVAAAAGHAQSPPPEDFLRAAIQDHLAGIRLGQLASDRGASPEVRAFGEELVDDHVAALAVARDLAAGLDVTPPDDVTEAAQASYDRLLGLSGAGFDHAFLEIVAHAHMRTIELFQAQTLSEVEAVAAHARALLPELQEHLDVAQKLPAS